MTIQESLQAILDSSDNFGRSFYDEFFLRHPRIFQYFEGVDMTRQSLVLTMALNTIVTHYTNPSVAIEHYLQHLGTMHNRWKIPPELYPKWSDTMLRVLERFLEGDWDEELASQWREALEKASQTLIRGYDRPVSI